ncbi:4'-phosphopantetheinyl transferase family protein [Citricoccus sp. NR2]|uniref:4'-phosphopantetheinyl transferase family protein n=1 Tax=Citricoccus sp. NR2 TaxID=3004095 RepID=UPI0022DD2C63|nr:4'-phosphopantetheinyl transferase superfamily protein [Citricoccus sp. NR2]WBL19050.1 4'-phosphopantetheinyl transferase superfamily protein [Citricoccus sp. NR2]
MYESFGDLDGLLFDDELEYAQGMLKKRRSEFATGRICARRALQKLGVQPVPILKDASGAPLWPANVVGSITHCRGYRAAAVGTVGEFMSIGIDAEPAQALPDGVLEQIAIPSEVSRLRHVQQELGSVPAGRLLFCIKEAIYKAWSPVENVWLDYDQAEVCISRDGSFEALIDRGHSKVQIFPELVKGRWRPTKSHLYAALIL